MSIYNCPFTLCCFALSCRGHILWYPLRMPNNFSKNFLLHKENNFYRSAPPLFFCLRVKANVFMVVLQNLIPDYLVELTCSCSPTWAHSLLHGYFRHITYLTPLSHSSFCSNITLSEAYCPLCFLNCKCISCLLHYDPYSFIYSMYHSLHNIKYLSSIICLSFYLSIYHLSIYQCFYLFSLYFPLEYKHSVAKDGCLSSWYRHLINIFSIF